MKTTFIKAIASSLLVPTTVASPSHKMIFDCDGNSLGGILFSSPYRSPCLFSLSEMTKLTNLTYTDVCDNMCFGD